RVSSFICTLYIMLCISHFLKTTLFRSLEGIGDTESVRIGASDVSVILGTNKWKCPARLFHHLTGFHDSFFMTERTISGHLMEDIIKRRWEALDTEDEMATLENVMEGTRLR